MSIALAGGMKHALFFFILIMASQADADEVIRSARKPERFGILGNVEPFAFPVPGKFGVVVFSRFPNNWQVEGAYARGSKGFGYRWFKLAAIQEETFTLRGRQYLAKNLHGFLGLGERHLKVTTLPQVSRYYETKSGKFRTPFLEGGFGSEWHPHPGFTFGVEWFSLAIPIGQPAIPGGRVLSLQVGWVFYEGPHGIM